VIQHHRTPALPEGITHVSLLQPVFGEFMQMCRSDTALERTDNEFLADFCKKMATHYGKLDNDNCRRTRCNDTLEYYLLERIRRPTAGNCTATDGSILWSYKNKTVRKSKYQSKLRFESMVLVNIEYKNEMGGRSGDPTMRNIGCFVNWLSECKLEKEYNVLLPSFLVSITGPLISVYGVVAYGGVIHCDPLTPYLHTLPVIDDNDTWRSLGRAMRALRLSIPKLDQYYSDLFMRGDAVPSYPGFPCPYLNRIIVDPNNTIEFAYMKQLARHVFMGILHKSGRKVIIKFIQSVQDNSSSIRGQRALASAGWAPDLIACSQLPPNWTVTVSAYVEDAVSYSSTQERDANLVTALQCLHDLNIVHGDIRASNVLVVPTSSLVYLIDFDHCGLHGVAKYQDRLYHADMPWPVGADMRVEHDKECAYRMMVSYSSLKS